MTERFIELSDGEKLFFCVYPAEDEKAVVHINHGMAEHSKRYENFISFLNKYGYTVYIQDHPGHGKSAKDGKKGFFKSEGGWLYAIEASHSVDSLIKKEKAGLKHMVIGHSMGSFITRLCLSYYPEDYDKAVIIGTGYSQGLLSFFGRIIARQRIKKYGPDYVDSFMNNMAFSSYSKHFKGEGSNAWLSRDKSEVEKYENDDFCGFVCTSSFYLDLIELIENANSIENARKVRKDLSMLILSGSEDPVGAYSKGVKKVEKLYKEAGVKDVRCHLYPGARHEILNETNRNEVYNDILNFLAGWPDEQ